MIIKFGEESRHSYHVDSRETLLNAAVNAAEKGFEDSPMYCFNESEQNPQWVVVLRAEICTRDTITPRLVKAYPDGAWMYLQSRAVQIGKGA